MNVDGKWRFTSPTHTVLALRRRWKSWKRKAEYPPEAGGMQTITGCSLKNGGDGFEPYIRNKYQGPIITTFLYPEDCNFSFSEMYQYVKERGYAIYPGKVTEADTFRIGNIGEIYRADIDSLCSIIREFLEVKENER